MDLKELCKEVDRIAILERREPDKMIDKRKTVKKRSRSGNATRYVFHFFMCECVIHLLFIFGINMQSANIFKLFFFVKFIDFKLTSVLS